jgi:iron-sulfur cluster assembly protein
VLGTKDERIVMLTLTRSAVEVVNTVMDGSGERDTAGLRIANAADSLQAEFVPGPAEGDQVVTQDGARVFMDPAAAAYLDDKVLTGELDEQGNVRFGLGQQEDAADPQ